MYSVLEFIWLQAIETYSPESDRLLKSYSSVIEPSIMNLGKSKRKLKSPASESTGTTAALKC